MRYFKVRFASCAMFTLLVAVPTSSVYALGYIQTNLVSDNASIPAVQHDPNLVNPWGIAALPTSPMWVSDNGMGISTLYNGLGAPQSLVVTIPTPNGGTPPSFPTGVIANLNTNDFGGSHFVFSTEDGTISAWTGGTSAVRMVDNSPASIYKGLAYENNGSTGNHLYATNFGLGQIDVFNSSFASVSLTGNFTDPNLSAGYAPFGIQNIGGKLFVTYAVRSGHDDVPGVGNGIVDIYSTTGTFMQRLISNGGVLNSPWGLAMAPSNFGELSNDLLVGNFGDGLIHAYNPSTGTLVETLNDQLGTPLMIEGLWGLLFGNGTATAPTNTLYFTAGPNDESDGLFGSLTVPEPASLTLLALGALGCLTRRRTSA